MAVCANARTVRDAGRTPNVNSAPTELGKRKLTPVYRGEYSFQLASKFQLCEASIGFRAAMLADAEPIAHRLAE